MPHLQLDYRAAGLDWQFGYSVVNVLQKPSYYYQYVLRLREQKDAILKQVDILVRQRSWSPAQADALRDDLNREDADLRAKWERLEKAKRGTSGRVVRPWLWDTPQYTVDNQPVIGVSWYEACAYAAWLTGMLRTQGVLSEQEEIRLPTEAEWEKAARGNTGRLWSWGNLWRSSFANSLEGRVMQPSTVGAYPRNKSPHGAQDMSGNVWEWCLDWYDENEYRNHKDGVQDPRGPATGSARVLRGGSWVNDRNFARCSYRFRVEPGYFLNVIGFRLVCSPSSPSLGSESLNSESLNR